MSSFEQRRGELLSFLSSERETNDIVHQTELNERSGIYITLAVLERERQGYSGLTIDPATVDRSLAFLKARRDCCDFTQAALLRMLYRYPTSQLLKKSAQKRIADASVDHIYWVNEPGEEDMCFCTENHQIIHHTNELLASQLFPDRPFEDGHDGAWHQQHAKRLINLWLEWRLRFGFSEWNSNCYYDEDLIALLNLADYAQNVEIQKRATAVTDLLLLHMALNSFQGVFGSTHGRTYTRMTLNPLMENIRAVAWLCFGQTGYDTALSMGATMMAASDYMPPSELTYIAKDQDVLENRERHSLDVSEAVQHGLDPHEHENIGFFWGAQVFHHPEVIEVSNWLCPEKHYKWERISQASAFYKEHERTGQPYEPDPDHQAMTQVNIYTYRTANYMLSCAQDYRKGRPGFQQHIWQATLPGNATVYTTHPGARDVGESRPDYWHGNGIMPRAVACKNVAICLYRLNTPQLPRFNDNSAFGMREKLAYTHAYFPQHLMDGVVEENGWVIGQIGASYVALRALGNMSWTAPQPEVLKLLPNGASLSTPYELVSEGMETGWILELGSETEHGSFEQFCNDINYAACAGDVDELVYCSPSIGNVRFGWEGKPLLNGAPIKTGPYPRIDNRFVQLPFDAQNDRDYTISTDKGQYTIQF